MAQSPPLNSGRRDEPAELNLREWALKARMISSRESTKSRRFSSSYITSFREDSKSFRSNINISSTASSPGYDLREEIDPSTYSFSSALRALQARSVNNNTREGFALNSKWNEAEKYICNPVSGEVPMECLSAKTLISGRSFRNLTSRITMSAPLIYPSHSRFIQTTPTYNDEAQFQNSIKAKEKKAANTLTRNVGVGSKLPDHLGSTTPAAAASSPPQLGENSPMSSNAGAGAGAAPKLKSEEDKGERKETDDGKEETEREEEEEETRKTEAGEKQVHHNNNNNMWKCRGGKIGCLSLRRLWMTRKSDKHKSRNKMKKKKKKNIFPLPCYNNINNNSGC